MQPEFKFGKKVYLCMGSQKGLWNCQKISFDQGHFRGFGKCHFCALEKPEMKSFLSPFSFLPDGEKKER